MQQFNADRSSSEIICSKAQRDNFCPLSLDRMFEKIAQNKELWDELRCELRERKIVTNLAAKEVLMNILRFKIKNVQDSTSAQDERRNDHTIKPFENVIKDFEMEKKEKKSSVTNLLSQKKKGLSSQYALPRFDINSVTLGKKLGQGSQSVMYEIKFFLENSFDPLHKRETFQECTQKMISLLNSIFLLIALNTSNIN